MIEFFKWAVSNQPSDEANMVMGITLLIVAVMVVAGVIYLFVINWIAGLVVVAALWTIPLYFTFREYLDDNF